MDNLLYTTFTFYGMHIYWLDAIALICFIACWHGYSLYAERQYHRSSNLMKIMNDMRTRWMRQMLKRDNRMTDSTLIGNLLRSISFFASTSIFILIGLVTVMGYRDKAMTMIHDIPFVMPSSIFMWEVKLILLSIIFIYAFFKFTWSLRLYNYACVIVGAAPFPNEQPERHGEYALKAGGMIGNASKHFNMALRGYYFGLAAIAWFLHPLIFMLAAAWVVFILYRREFLSQAVNNIGDIFGAND